MKMKGVLIAALLSVSQAAQAVSLKDMSNDELRTVAQVLHADAAKGDCGIRHLAQMCDRLNTVSDAVLLKLSVTSAEMCIDSTIRTSLRKEAALAKEVGVYVVATTPF